MDVKLTLNVLRASFCMQRTGECEQKAASPENSNLTGLCVTLQERF